MNDIFQSRHITSADANTTVTVCAAPAALMQIVIGTTSAQALTVKNGTASRSVIKASILEQTLFYNDYYENGISVTVPTGYTGSATVIFDPQ